MTCDHPKCDDDVHKTYSDDHGNDLELCEAHYYYLVSGEGEPSPDPFGGRLIDTPPVMEPGLGSDIEPPGDRRRER